MKKFKLNKKSVMSFVLSAIMLVSMSSMAMLCYAWKHPTTEAFNVTLYADQTKTYSGAKVAEKINFEGRNHGKTIKVWFTPQYTFNSDQSNFKDDTAKEILIPADTNYYNGVSSTDKNKPWWRLCLDTYGVGTGGTAYAWCW